MSITLSNALIQEAVLGIGLVSPLVTDPNTGDFLRCTEDDNVKFCIMDLLSTPIGTRLMNEDFGVAFPPLLFENIDGVVHAAPVLARNAIQRFEPRATNVQTSAQKIGISTVQVSISWTVKATGSRDNLVFPFYLQPPSGSGTS